MDAKKRIAIGPETLISHFGIIKTHKKQKNIKKQQKQQQKKLNLFAVLWALLDPLDKQTSNLRISNIHG